MEIRTLENISIEKIVDAFAESFKDYYVKIPHDYDYWRERLRLARFNQNLSVGSFDGDQLVAFILKERNYELVKLQSINGQTHYDRAGSVYQRGQTSPYPSFVALKKCLNK